MRRVMSQKLFLSLSLCFCLMMAGRTVQAEEVGAEKVKVEEEVNTLRAFNKVAFSVIFFDVSGGTFTAKKTDDHGKDQFEENGDLMMQTIKVPFVVALLALGSIFFTFYYRLVNFRFFAHAIQVIRGKYDDPNDHGEISHFKALCSALSATVGLGNIAGVAVAIQSGGPGAVFWMVSLAVFGMCAKFSSCTLAQLYRQTNADGSISGGPMYYIDLGLREMKLGALGKFLGVIYAFMLMGGALGGGNMFQVNQTAESIRTTFGFTEDVNIIVGIVMLVMVGIVIIGGIRRIGTATSRIIPSMCGLYVAASLIILFANASKIPESLQLIFEMAFTSNAMFGGALGVMVTGMTRAAFSNEAGLGSAAVIHAAAKTSEPVREGMVAMLGPFIDTIVICTMTALVVIVSGAWNDPSIPSSAGVELTSAAFATVLPWFPKVLTVSIVLFAYSTMISWCYYGERGWIYLVDHFGAGKGIKSVLIFRLIFLSFILVGALNEFSDVVDFSDAMILSLAFPNIIGSVILAPKVIAKLKDYCARLKSGEMKTYE
jgi:AGCS family alanine or glycine:cation symporter